VNVVTPSGEMQRIDASSHPQSNTGPLQGLRVLDCTHGTAGPRAGGILADYGADVVRVEPPGGDPWRENLRIDYAAFDRGKRSVMVDLQSPSGRESFELLLGEADVLIESWRPGVAESLGLDHASLHERFPHLVVATITGFGLTGRYSEVPGYESLVHALVGTMAEQIGMREPPIFEGVPFASIGAAYLSVIGLLAALYRRNDDGIGRHVETSLYDGALAYLVCFWGESDAEAKERSGVTENDFLVAGNSRLICGFFRTADDLYMGVHSGAVGGFGRLMKILGLDDRIPSREDGLDTGVPLTETERDILHKEIHQIFAQANRDEWIDRLLEVDVCAVPAQPPTEAFDSPQAKANKSTVEVVDAEFGRLEQVAPAISLSATPARIMHGAPQPGSTKLDELVAEWIRPHESLWIGSGALNDRPILDGVRILDLGAWFAGPYSSRLLAEMGADVIKLETLGGDSLRGIPVIFRAAQANKRDLSIDLKHPELRRALDGLVSWADIIYHNMRPGAAERLGVGYDQVRQKKPAIIYGYAPGWGPEGPDAQRQSFEPMMSGYVGVGFEAAGQFNPPLYPQGNADPGNGLNGAVGMLLCLLHRLRTGDGQRYVNPQLDATMAHLMHIVRRVDTGEVLNAGKLDPLQLGTSALERLYETADGWICLSALKFEHLDALAKALEIEIVSDPRFDSADTRSIHDNELSDLLASAFHSRSTESVLACLSHLSVPVAEPVPYNNFIFMRDPENVEAGRVAISQDPELGQVRELARLVRVSDAREVPHKLAPKLGEHTDHILIELGYDPIEIESLAERGAIRRHLAPTSAPIASAH
jgi:crotonobetainyl-CoA:carnitine CoA-transferase CaiB-like acyl-CoA transferase